MALTIPELTQRLAKEHELDYLLELLDISKEELLEAFEDKVEERYDALLDSLTNFDEEDQP